MKDRMKEGMKGGVKGAMKKEMKERMKTGMKEGIKKGMKDRLKDRLKESFWFGINRDFPNEERKWNSLKEKKSRKVKNLIFKETNKKKERKWMNK